MRYVAEQSNWRIWRRLLVFTVCALLGSIVLPLAGLARSSGPYTIRTNLRATVHVSGAQLDAFIRSRHPSSPLIGLGTSWVAAGERYGINPFYLMANAIHESNWGRSSLARRKNNIYGWRAFTHCSAACAATFASKVDCINTVVPLIDRLYLRPDGPYWTRYGATLQGVNVHYAADRGWKYTIATIMNQAAEFTGRT